MSLRRVVAGLMAVVLAMALVVLYRGHRREVVQEAERQAPVMAPSRVSGDSEAAVVTLAAGERRRVGIELAVVRSTSGGAESRMPGEVVPETERAAVLRAPVAGRFTLPDGARWPALGERVAADVPLAQVSDARPLALPIGGVVTRVGAQPGALVEAGQALLEVADYSHPLVRVAWLDPAGGAPPARLAVGPGSASGATRCRHASSGPAPEADPVTRRAAYLYRAERAWPGATPGTPVVAFVSARLPRRGKRRSVRARRRRRPVGRARLGVSRARVRSVRAGARRDGPSGSRRLDRGRAARAGGLGSRARCRGAPVRGVPRPSHRRRRVGRVSPASRAC